MKRAMALLAIVLGLAALSGISDAQPKPNRLAWPMKPALPGLPRDGISGSSVARAGAHGVVGGPAAGKPAVIGSIDRRQRH